MKGEMPCQIVLKYLLSIEVTVSVLTGFGGVSAQMVIRVKGRNI